MKGLVVVVVVSCIPRSDITHVTLHDPANLAVEVETLAGPATVMPVGELRGGLAATVPPYIGTAEQGSWVERDGASIVAWCPKCKSTRRVTLVDRPEVVLAGNAYELLRFDGDRLHMRSDFLAGAPCHRRRTCVVPKLALELVTPLSNVASIDYEQRLTSHDSGSGIGVVFGAFYAAGGATLGGFGIADHQRELEIAGACMAALGAGLVAWMVHDLRATDEHTAIPLRSR